MTRVNAKVLIMSVKGSGTFMGIPFPELREGDEWVAEPVDEGGAIEHLAKNKVTQFFSNYRQAKDGSLIEVIVFDGKFNLTRPALRFPTEKWVGDEGEVENGVVVHCSVDQQTGKRFRYYCRHDGKLLGISHIPKTELKGV